MRRLAALGVLLVAPAIAPPVRPAPAPGGRVTGKVQLTRDGRPLADASGVVVYLVGFEEPPPVGVVPEVRQQSRRFDPPLLAVTRGQEVAFPNADPFFHNVFSPSPARKFDLGQFKRGIAKKKAFPETGVVDVFCNIHPEMAATILVLPNRRHTVTRADGSFVLEGVPPGTWTAYAFDRHALRPERAPVTVAAGGTAELTFRLEEERFAFPHKNKYGETYRDRKKYR
jgi:plastocyanin